MNPKPPSLKPPPAPRLSQLCLQFEASPALGASGATDSVDRLARALRLAPFSSLILSGPDGARPLAADIRPLVEMAQSQGIATLIQGDIEVARTVGADGVHIPWSDDVEAQFAEARQQLGARFIVGADAGRSRHAAMALAEGGADYIGFGIPLFVEDRETAAERRLDLAAWWAEIFEVPVMALDVESAADAGVLCAAQADFIAMRIASSLDSQDMETRITAISLARVSGPEGSILAV